MSIKGPAIFLAQFAGDDAPFNNLENISKWASDLGYLGDQIPSWDERLINLRWFCSLRGKRKSICKTAMGS